MLIHNDHVLIFGYDPGARVLLETLLAELGGGDHELVILGPGERPVELPEEFIWVSGDPSKEAELYKVHAGRARAVIIVGSRKSSPQNADANTILLIFTLRGFLAKQPDGEARHRPVYLVAEILDPENAGHARSAGADEVIETHRLGFAMISHAITAPGSGEAMSEVASAGANSLYIGAYPSGLGKTFSQLSAELEARLPVNIIGVRRGGDRSVELNPPQDLLFSEQMSVVYLGREELQLEAPPS